MAKRIKDFYPSPKMARKAKSIYGPKVTKGVSLSRPESYPPVAGYPEMGLGNGGGAAPKQAPFKVHGSPIPPHISLEQLIGSQTPKTSMGLRGRQVPGTQELGINPKRNKSA